MRKILILSAIVTAFTCAGAQKATPAPDEALQALQERYYRLEKIKARALIKTTWQGAPYDFEADLSVVFQKKSSEPASFKLVLKDIVFLAPLYTLSLSGQTIEHIDHSKNITTHYDKKNYQWNDLIDLPLPAHHLVGFLTSQVPDLFFQKSRKIKENLWLSKTHEGSYHFTLKKENLHTIEFQPLSSSPQVLIEYIGKNPYSKKRPFPERVRVSNKASGEKLTFIYKKITLL